MDIIEAIEQFRRQALPLYNEALRRHTAKNVELDTKFYKLKKNRGKEAPLRPEFDVETDEMFRDRDILKTWRNLLRNYKRITGNDYRKSLIINTEREDALRSNLQAKDEARSARDLLIEKRRAERFAREEEARRQEALKPSRDYIDAKKYYDTVTNIELVLDSLISARVPTKANKQLFSDMKSLVSEIGKKAEEEVKDYVVKGKVSREKLDAKLRAKEAPKRGRPAKAPKPPKAPKEAKRRGRPIDLNSKRQIKLGIDCQKREEYLKGL